MINSFIHPFLLTLVVYTTRFLRLNRCHLSSSVQPNPEKKNLDKSQTISKKNFFFFIFFAEKKCYNFSFSILEGRTSTRPLQYSPFENPGRGGYPESDEEGMDGRTESKRKSLCLIVAKKFQKFQKISKNHLFKFKF